MLRLADAVARAAAASVRRPDSTDRGPEDVNRYDELGRCSEEAHSSEKKYMHNTILSKCLNVRYKFLSSF